MLYDAGVGDVLVALIFGLPGIISAVYAARIHRQVKTPSGTPLGRQVEDTNHLVIGNRHILEANRLRHRRDDPSHSE